MCDDAFFTNIGLHQRILGSVRFGVGRNPLVVVAVDECQVSGQWNWNWNPGPGPGPGHDPGPGHGPGPGPGLDHFKS